MKKLAIGIILLSGLSVAAKPPGGGGGNTVSLSCASGVTASAQGAYGGVPFSLSCRSGRTTTVSVGTLTTFDYAIQMAGHTQSTAFDCVPMTGTGPDTRVCGGLVTATFQ